MFCFEPLLEKAEKRRSDPRVTRVCRPSAAVPRHDASERAEPSSAFGGLPCAAPAAAVCRPDGPKMMALSMMAFIDASAARKERDEEGAVSTVASGTPVSLIVRSRCCIVELCTPSRMRRTVVSLKTSSLLPICTRSTPVWSGLMPTVRVPSGTFGSPLDVCILREGSTSKSPRCQRSVRSTETLHEPPYRRAPPMIGIHAFACGLQRVLSHMRTALERVIVGVGAWSADLGIALAVG
mmetsp:Transcript_28335/g.72899  ORF Transcript_28335/g.72899 Transcript_28335/m.72899 type:complete len:238 (+) Transcript_28335:256-969(+)